MIPKGVCVYCGIGVFVRGGVVGGYDNVSHFYIAGELPNLYHHGEASHLVLALNGLGTGVSTTSP